MLRKVTVFKPDVCQGDFAGDVEFQLDDDMTIPAFLRFLANDLLVMYLHYPWEIIGGDPCQTLGFIAREGRDKKPPLKTPGDVCRFLNHQLRSDDLIQCCVPPDQTLKDLNVTEAACWNLA